jgi:hypothetical protein
LCDVRIIFISVRAARRNRKSSEAQGNQRSVRQRRNALH